MATPRHPDRANVYDLFTGSPLNSPASAPIIRVSPETDGLCALYSSDEKPDTVFNIVIVCWALYRDGTVDAMVPWLDALRPCRRLDDPRRGRWEGFYDAETGQGFLDPPQHKVAELHSAAAWFGHRHGATAVQEFADTVGTHVLQIDTSRHHMILNEVISWRLTQDGTIHAMLADSDRIDHTPVLPGDKCLFCVDDARERHYFFQHHAANQIKLHDPETMAALALLFRH